MSLLGWSLFADEFHGQNYRYRYRLDIDIDTDMILLEFKVIFQIQDYGIFHLLTSVVFHLYLLSSILKIPVLKDTGNDEIRNSRNYLLVFSSLYI